MKLTTNFWGCNETKQIRIGYWKRNGVFKTVGSVLVKGAEYSDEEAARATALAKAMSGKSRAVEFDLNIKAA